MERGREEVDEEKKEQPIKMYGLGILGHANLEGVVGKILESHELGKLLSIKSINPQNIIMIIFRQYGRERTHLKMTTFSMSGSLVLRRAFSLRKSMILRDSGFFARLFLENHKNEILPTRSEGSSERVHGHHMRHLHGHLVLVAILLEARDEAITKAIEFLKFKIKSRKYEGKCEYLANLLREEMGRGVLVEVALELDLSFRDLSHDFLEAIALLLGQAKTVAFIVLQNLQKINETS